MPLDEDDGVELEPLHRPEIMEEREADAGLLRRSLNDDASNDEDLSASQSGQHGRVHQALDRSTKRKLDCILLPFLALLFLLNSLDKSNVGNAETAGFTRDAGLQPDDLNTSMGYFFAFFVALQPVGAALGRKFGMRRWVPGCMTLWGMCTLLHIWIRRKWQLICLRILIAALEAGFYPTTVNYLSLFYTRYEFAVRLGFFYGQTAVAGVLGGILSWGVFSRFEKGPSRPDIPPPVTQAIDGEWRSWEVLFLIEGCTTMFVALIGFFWLPHSADSAWFFTAQERRWAEQRIRLDQLSATNISSRSISVSAVDEVLDEAPAEEDLDSEAHHGLLHTSKAAHRRMSTATGASVTEDSGLSRHDVLSAFLNYKIWHILAVNILSAIPATAFGVFLPLVIKQLSPSLNLSPSASNLLSAPPFACGAVALFVFTRWSDHSKQRLVPIFWGLGLLLLGLLLTLLIPKERYGFRYFALCILLSGSFIASPLTVAWITNNTPEQGKRAILLGINGWGNLAGIFLALLFTPEDRKNGYIRPFIITLVCVMASFVGYIAFWVMLVRENKRRADIVAGWDENLTEREEVLGDVPVPTTGLARVWKATGFEAVARRLGLEDVRKGDGKMTFRYGL
ncbi:uncharacterized protein LTR77_002449 [Saxophila tyrrhenica]|uniref:MFS general substrate transporter n=1 Tax=Saxophila tyrrhenica TaxID=1690608 RepID=A0AAV9PNE0_9PEZI|nr:hypothetical protein LTR77_002449 [Saxophila tyrrhenica]